MSEKENCLSVLQYNRHFKKILRTYIVKSNFFTMIRA